MKDYCKPCNLVVPDVTALCHAENITKGFIAIKTFYLRSWLKVNLHLLTSLLLSSCKCRDFNATSLGLGGQEGHSTFNLIEEKVLLWVQLPFLKSDLWDITNISWPSWLNPFTALTQTSEKPLFPLFLMLRLLRNCFWLKHFSTAIKKK